MGFRVLELSDGEGAAAYAGKLFARWGSEVIKVEAPSRDAPERALDLYLNGGKRRVAADFRLAADRAALDGLAASCDILLTDADSRDVRAFELLSLGDASGASSGPKVRVSITPFGLSGPYADAPATPATLLALGGYTFFMGDPDREPLTLPGNYTNYQAGGYAYVAALASALRAPREPDAPVAPVTIEVSMLECIASLHQMTDTRWIDGRHIRSRHGSRMEVAGNSMLRAKDGWVGFSIGQQFWEPFVQMLGRPEAAEAGHPMATMAGRAQLIEEILEMVAEAVKGMDSQQFFSEGQEKWRVPVGRLSSMADVLVDPHLAERSFWRPVARDDGSQAQGIVTPGSPFQFVGEEQPVELATVISVPIGEFVGDAPIHPHPSPLLEGEGVAPTPVSHSVQGAAAPMALSGLKGRDSQHSALSPARPLEGVRILDLTRIWAGPAAARILGDLGADMIKIEEASGRGGLEVPRGNSGYQVVGADELWEPWNHQSLFNKLNRNHRSVCVDLKSAKGRDLFLRLVAVSDVVMENFSARAMSRLGLGYEALRAVNERIILVPMPAFGKRGPYRDYVGLGPSVEPLAGLPSLMGYPGGDPKTSAKAIPDAIAAVQGAIAVMTALERRERTGLGAEVDLSQHEGSVASIGEYLIERQLSGVEPERFGNGHPVHSPHGIYRCAGEENWIALAARDEAEWAALAGLAGEGWAADSRFASEEGRRAHRQALDALVGAWTAGQDKFALMAELMKRGVPAGAVYKAPEYLADAQLEARGYFAGLRHPETGAQRYDGSPLEFDGERGYDEWKAPPKLGEHNWEVLRELLGMAEEEYEGLVREGVLADRPPA